jgi:hypothetical protein
MRNIPEKYVIAITRSQRLPIAIRDVSRHSLIMLLWIAIAGGLTLMMGQHSRSESLFYYVRLEDQVPENHLLRLIDKHVDFGFIREHLKDSYSDMGRPSTDPELMLRILLLGYLNHRQETTPSA